MGFAVKDLTKHYGSKLVVDALSFEMPGPGVYALLGTNGAGKTTSIRMMLNMLERDCGEVLWNESPLTAESCNVGYLAEERGLYPKYSLMDQLMYFAQLRGVRKDEAKRRIADYAAKLAVEEYLFPQRTGRRRTAPKSLKADQLSKGNQQKIQLMAALISDPELIILDEPLSGLDPVNADIFKSLIREQIEAGKYIIMSSHQMSTVEEFCTDITILDRSRTVLQGNLNSIKRSYGRVNLRIKVEKDISDIIRTCGARIVSEKEFEYNVKVSGEEQANALLRQLIGANVSIVAFDLSEPTLHEIFVEKVEKSDAHE